MSEDASISGVYHPTSAALPAAQALEVRADLLRSSRVISVHPNDHFHQLPSARLRALGLHLWHRAPTPASLSLPRGQRTLMPHGVFRTPQREPGCRGSWEPSGMPLAQSWGQVSPALPAEVDITWSGAPASPQGLGEGASTSLQLEK